ncbi:MAG: LapA family protein [Deltaproteobacteria bacterium]|nr:LapA family protein [Deltaproteobacteria bacterium]
MKKLNYKKIISLVLAALTILFILQNIAVINISFLFWTFFISRSVLIFLVLLIGIVIGWLLRSIPKRKAE